ncbi:DUF86 domain-containing protein [Parapedobacter deserti]|uniref:DUF86 domain-containing protein n=1 Tax=Parapedobacter deserti TaxID=1912957 RepID=A0ABV7JL97_9SPHI
MQQNPDNDLTYLLRILESIQKIHLYASPYDDVLDFFFANDQKDFNASLMLIINIGEQATRLSDSLKSDYPAIPWRLVVGFRNRVAHDYAGLDTFKVFDLIKNHLTPLKERIEALINDRLLNNSLWKEELTIAKNSTYYKHIDFARLVK